MQIGRVVRHCVLGAALAACTRTDGRAVMDDSTFVAAMARLHSIERKYQLTDAARDSLRRAVLQEQGLTREQLERQARHYAGDPARASAIWTAISKKTLTLNAADTQPADGSGGSLQEQTR
jgi:hypothetical protein